MQENQLDLLLDDGVVRTLPHPLFDVNAMSQADFDYLGPYHVERLLGRGGMGSVYKGLHAKSGDPVAIKVIATGIANQTRFRRRFSSEIEALKRLKHPNIVELIGYGEEKGLLFYSMEYVDGHSLHDHLRQHGSLPWEDVVQVAIETTSALKHAHNIGIIHRDLKPANLMLSKAGHIKLTDFGISKLFGAGDETLAGSVIGTADYMPPEQAEGKPVNVRSDLYSLGSVMYALLTGKAPFGGKSVPEVLYAVRYNPIPDLSSRVANVPEDLIALINQLLEKDPLKRPPTALVVGNRLKALQQGMQRKLKAGDTLPPEDNPATPTQVEVGPQLTSLDLSDVEDAELKLTGAELKELGIDRDIAEETRRGEGPLGTHEQKTIAAPEGATDRAVNSSNAGTRIHSTGKYVEPDDLDHELSFPPEPQSSVYRSLNTDGELVTSGGPSHYTPVSDYDTSRTSFGTTTTEQESSTDWLQIGSIAGIIILLVTSVGAGWWMLQPPSANELYDSITTAVDSGDDGQLLAASGSIANFISRFPADDRIDEVKALGDEAELIRRAKLLQRKAARAGGVNELSAIEQAFLDCLEVRSNDAQAAEMKFAAFLTLFANLDELDRNERRLVELAQFAVRTNESVVIPQQSAAKIQLEKLIQSAEKSLSGNKLESYYRDLLLFYADKPWAVEQTTRIKKILDGESSKLE